MVVAHLRKHTLNHVPGRHAGPPKQMPSWLSDGPRLLKIPRKSGSGGSGSGGGGGGDEGILSPAGSPRAGSPSSSPRSPPGSGSHPLDFL